MEENIISGEIYCKDCGDRIYREAYIIDGVNYCNKCLKKNFMYKVVDAEDPDPIESEDADNGEIH